MEPSYLPVETILKVDENELIIGDNQTASQNDFLQSNITSTDMKCNNWKIESPQRTECNVSSEVQGQRQNISSNNMHETIDAKHPEEMPINVREWLFTANDSHIPDHREASSNLGQPIPCNFQSFPEEEEDDDDFFSQFDYKTRNKLKTKQRRLDPFYRCQERVRQRTVMRMKRQDPGFRAVEREKGRCRMRMKRLDPEFRSLERERQRERMKIKRSNPDFREKEREQQKTRLHEKRLDPAFKEKEKAQNQLRMCIKRQASNMQSSLYSDNSSSLDKNAEMRFSSENPVEKNDLHFCRNPIQIKSSQAVFPENIDTKMLNSKSKRRESAFEAFHFKKQRFLNFNFYNSNEQWFSHGELYSKAMACVTVLEKNDGFKLPFKTEVNVPLSNESLAVVSKENVIDNDKTQKLLDIKLEDLPPAAQQQKLSKTNEFTPFCIISPCDEK